MNSSRLKDILNEFKLKNKYDVKLNIKLMKFNVKFNIKRVIINSLII